MARTVERVEIEKCVAIDGTPTRIIVNSSGFWVYQGSPADRRLVHFGHASGLDAVIDMLLDMREEFIRRAPLEREA